MTLNIVVPEISFFWAKSIMNYDFKQAMEFSDFPPIGLCYNGMHCIIYFEAVFSRKAAKTNDNPTVMTKS